MKYIKKYEYKKDDLLSYKFEIGDYVRVINPEILYDFIEDYEFSDDQIFIITDITDNYETDDKRKYLMDPIGIETDSPILSNDNDIIPITKLEIDAIKFNL